MKRILALIFVGLMTLTGTSQANPHHGHPNYGHHNGWIAPLVIGSALGYVVSQRQQPVIVQQPVVVYPNTYPSVPPYGYHYEQMLDANCNCYRVVLVPNY